MRDGVELRERERGRESQRESSTGRGEKDERKKGVVGGVGGGGTEEVIIAGQNAGGLSGVRQHGKQALSSNGVYGVLLLPRPTSAQPNWRRRHSTKNRLAAQELRSRGVM
jgi:hypothetical protein